MTRAREKQKKSTGKSSVHAGATSVYKSIRAAQGGGPARDKWRRSTSCRSTSPAFATASTSENSVYELRTGYGPSLHVTERHESTVVAASQLGSFLLGHVRSRGEYLLVHQGSYSNQRFLHQLGITFLLGEVMGKPKALVVELQFGLCVTPLVAVFFDSNIIRLPVVLVLDAYGKLNKATWAAVDLGRLVVVVVQTPVLGLGVTPRK